MESLFFKLTTIMCALLGVSYGCSCLPRTQLQVACNSNIVVRAVASNCYISNDKQICRFLVKQVLKGSNSFRSDLEKNKFVLKADTMYRTSCEAAPVEGITYIIATHLNDDGTILLNLCTYFQQWSQLTQKEKDGFNCYYYKYCE